MWEYVLITCQIGLCCWVVWDDFKNREINILAPITLCFLLLVKQVFFSEPFFLWSDIFKNAIVAIIIFGIAFFYLKYLKKTENPLKTHLGIGDLLFFLSLVAIGTPLYYIFIFVVLTSFSLMVGIVGTVFLNWKNIPYAGISAIGLIFFLISPYFNLTFEQWLLYKLL